MESEFKDGDEKFDPEIAAFSWPFGAVAWETPHHRSWQFLAASARSMKSLYSIEDIMQWKGYDQIGGSGFCRKTLDQRAVTL